MAWVSAKGDKIELYVGDWVEATRELSESHSLVYFGQVQGLDRGAGFVDLTCGNTINIRHYWFRKLDDLEVLARAVGEHRAFRSVHR